MTVELNIENLRFDASGLLAAIIQDATDGTVLMLGFMNAEALALTLSSGDVWFWSRSRSALWHKGETSGNFLRLVHVHADCDGDALLLQVSPSGPTCHTGERSCFSPGDTATTEVSQPGVRATMSIERLWSVIADRKEHPEEGSYTTHLLRAGVDRIGRKIGEEAAETIIAAKNHSALELTGEVSDLLYHTLVLMASEDITLQDISAELERRHGAPRRHREAASQS